MLKLMKHQEDCINNTKEANRVAYYLDMGLGKTFVGSEKMKQLNENLNVLICQKSLIKQWIAHFSTYYKNYEIIDCTKIKEPKINQNKKTILIVNYDIIFRRDYFKDLSGFTMILDESSLIQNENSKRSKAILKLKAKNVILLSGTPTGGKYEKLWSQCKLLGWNISKKEFYNNYIIEKEITVNGMNFPIKIIVGYKNIEDLKNKLKEHNAVFMKTEEVISLPEQQDIILRCDKPKEYDKFNNNRVVVIDDNELVGDMVLTKLLYSRQICGLYNNNKYEIFSDLLDSTDDRLIVFYNFTEEKNRLLEVIKKKGRPFSIINGEERNLENYEKENNSITLLQYQAGSMGLNLQKANKIVYFSPPLSSELFEQSKKRTHRIGQKENCFYYYMVAENTIEEHIYKVLKTRNDYTATLFEKNENV